MREVTAVVLEGGVPGDGFAVYLESRNAVRNRLRSVRQNRSQRLAKPDQRASVGFWYAIEILVNGQARPPPSGPPPAPG